MSALTINIPYTLAGLNGSDGLIRQHHHAAKRVKDGLLLLVKPQRPAGWVVPARVRITYIRHSANLLDWDNCAASAKHLLDAVVRAGIIADDSPKVVAEFVVRQGKTKRAEQRTELIIEKIN